MGEKEKRFRQEIARQNTTGFSGLLGCFTKEEQEFLAKVKKKEEKKSPEYFDFFPTEEKMNEYIEKSLTALFGEEEIR